MRRAFVTFGAALATSALVMAAIGLSGGCAYDWSFTSDGGSDDEDAFDSGSQEDTSIPERDAVSPTEAAPPACTPGGGVCPPGQYCKYPDRLCGRNEPGTCEPFLQGCNVATNEPVCLCGNELAKDPCGPSMQNKDVDVKGTCTPEIPFDGYFQCGYRFCKGKDEFCEVDFDKVSGREEYTCQPLKGCTPVSCDCPLIPPPSASCSCKEIDPMVALRVECTK